MASILTARDLHNRSETVASKRTAPGGRVRSRLFLPLPTRGGDWPQAAPSLRLEVYPGGEQERRPYLVTEYVRGHTLLHRLGSGRVFPEREALALAGLICEGLEYLHQQGVIHCAI